MGLLGKCHVEDGFRHQVGAIELIMTFISSVRYHILHNGRELGPILPQRGLRQGDPLSPYVFIICAEALT